MLFSFIGFIKFFIFVTNKVKMDKYKVTFKTWNKVASLYEDKFMELNLYNPSYDAFCKLLKANAKVLEIGCGPGNITKYLLAKKPNLKILGLDIAPNMIALAKKNNPTANFKIMDGREIGNIQVRYNAIVCGFYIPYLSKLECCNFIKDCCKLLSENGILYLSFVAGNPNDSGYKTGSNGDKMYFNYHNLKDIKSNLLKNNFRIVEQIEVNYPINNIDFETHTILIANVHST